MAKVEWERQSKMAERMSPIGTWDFHSTKGPGKRVKNVPSHPGFQMPKTGEKPAESAHTKALLAFTEGRVSTFRISESRKAAVESDLC